MTEFATEYGNRCVFQEEDLPEFYKDQFTDSTGAVWLTYIQLKKFLNGDNQIWVEVWRTAPGGSQEAV